MNKENAKQFLPLVQALADGKVIQAKQFDGTFYDVLAPEFNMQPGDYRIKPEPRRIWVNEYEGAGIAHKSKEDATTEAHGHAKRIAVEYVEVIK